MSRQSLHNRYSLTLFIMFSIFVTSLVPPAIRAQNDGRKPVVISFGQPNIWSLEQAHYLLARMHMTNLDLQAKTLSDTDLDPNATHGTRIQILKQLLEIGATFDQGVGFQNQRLVENARFNDDRRRNLTTNRDRLRAESLKLELEKNELKRERKSITDETSDRAKELDAQIEEKTKNQEKVDKEIDFHDGEISKITEPTGTPATPSVSPSPFDKTRLPSSIIDKLTDQELQNLLSPGRDPKLNATTMLDNTVQLQYEIIAKQLTLLRDEVGPGERLVFLELPQSIYTTPGPGDEKMAQAWWHINGYTRIDKLVRLLLELFEVERKWYEIRLVPAFRALDPNFKLCDGDIVEKTPKAEDVDKTIQETYKKLKEEHDAARVILINPLFKEANEGFDRVEQNGARDTSVTIDAVRKILEITSQKPAQTNADKHKPLTFVERANQPRAKTKDEEARDKIQILKKDLLSLLSMKTPDVCKNSDFSFDKGIEFIRLDDERGDKAAKRIERRTVRAVDIIPRQSSLNVNDVQSTVKATGILAAFKFLFGFAGQVNFQRQREQFEQFVHQELYASGFGKGNRDFGWTFGALPGTKRVAPGVRTTYAVVVVPEEAESIVLSARGCYFPRKTYQPLDFTDTGHEDWDDDDKFRRYNCTDQQTYMLNIPGGGNTSNFWVTDVDYEDGKNSGEFTTVSVRGRNFSSQMGVLIDGVPLSATVGLAQQHLTPKTTNANGAAAQTIAKDCSNITGICGSYERVDSQQIVFSFKMPANYPGGTPTITLIGPGKAVDLNPLPNLTINKANVILKTQAPFMFGTRPSPVLSIKDVLLLDDPVGPTQRALLVGTKFVSAHDIIYVNGTKLVAPSGKNFISENLYELNFPVSANETIKVTLVQDKTVVSKSVPNPVAFKLLTPTVISYKPAANNKPSLAVVRLEGTDFRPRIQLSAVTGADSAQLQFVSPNRFIIRLVNPQPPIFIQLVDPITGGLARAVVEQLPEKEPPKSKSKPEKKPKQQ